MIPSFNYLLYFVGPADEATAASPKQSFLVSRRCDSTKSFFLFRLAIIVACGAQAYNRGCLVPNLGACLAYNGEKSGYTIAGFWVSIRIALLVTFSVTSSTIVTH